MTLKIDWGGKKKKEYYGLKKNGKRERLLEIDTEGGQGATWTVQPVDSGN
jgi:hypothetical protein